MRRTQIRDKTVVDLVELEPGHLEQFSGALAVLFLLRNGSLAQDEQSDDEDRDDHCSRSLLAPRQCASQDDGPCERQR